MSDPVEITIDGERVRVDPTQPLIAAIHGHGVHVPHYCYHPGLSTVGSCRMCQVEVQQGEMPPRVVAACRISVAPGMVVNTTSQAAGEVRRECLEFLLKNHPLDCPICDKAGECLLQDYAFDEGQTTGRSNEPRRKLAKRKSLGDVILLDQERCILCSRCVRFMEEVPKTPQLCISGRGSHSVVETYDDRPLTGNYQGNLADICPVGALTLKRFRFQARVWNLSQTAGTCPECSRGCARWVEVLRHEQVKRLRPRHDPEVNGYWMCDTGRFALDELNRPERLSGARLRNGYGGWDEASTAEALERARDMLAARGEALVAASPFLTVEEGGALAALAKTLGARTVFVSPEPNDLADDLLHTGDPCPNRRGLTELGFEALPAEEVLEIARGHEALILAGERALDLVGREALAELPATLRALLLECHLCDAPAIDIAVGIPDCVERSGNWVNVDGHQGRILPARPAPPGVWTLERTLDHLHTLLTTEPEASAP